MELGIAVALIVAVAFFFQRITGFGSAVVATPLLVLIWTPHEAIALMLIFQAAFGLWLVRGVWRRLLDVELRPFLIVFLPAVVVGAYMLPGLSAGLVRRCLAGVCVLVLLQWLLIPESRFSRRWRPVAGAVSGLLSGLVQGAFGMGGPFFLAYYRGVESRPGRIRDSTIAVFLVSNLLRPPVALATAQFSGPVLSAALYAIVPFVAAMVLGARLADRIDVRIYRYLVVVILAVAAVQLALG